MSCELFTNKGMMLGEKVFPGAVAEFDYPCGGAIAHGLPVVSTLAGAIPDTVPAGTGLLVPPDDVTALAQALRRLICARTERERLAMNARAAATQLPTWQESARLFVGAIEAA